MAVRSRRGFSSILFVGTLLAVVVIVLVAAYLFWHSEPNTSGGVFVGAVQVDLCGDQVYQTNEQNPSLLGAYTTNQAFGLSVPYGACTSTHLTATFVSPGWTVTNISLYPSRGDNAGGVLVNMTTPSIPFNGTLDLVITE